ncbi:thioredoxin domain-containing protein, partial [Chroococcidiopsis cubana CCALA 043]
YSELENILTSEELTAIQAEFTVTPQGNFEGKNVLQRRQVGILSETVESALKKLFQVRYGSTVEELEIFPPARNNQEAKTQTWAGRIPAVTDTKMIVAWNSLMISGLARAAIVFQQNDYLDLAVRAANFILENQWVDGRFHRLNYDGKAAVMAQSEDYAQFIKALLDLHQASLVETLHVETLHVTSLHWLEKAIAVQTEFDELLWSVELGGYFNTAKDASQELIIRERSYMDNATPAANGVAIANLVRLALLTEDLTYLDRAEQGFQAFSSAMHQHPQACPSLFTAFDWYSHCTTIRTSQQQIETFLTQYLPAAVLTQADNLPDSSVGLVCKGLTCLAPAETLEKMQQQIQQSQMRGM